MYIKKDAGFIKWIILIVVALIILGFYGFDLKSAIEKPTVQKNISYVTDIVVNIWTKFIKKPFLFLEGLFLDYIWHPAFNLLKEITNHNSPPVAPTVGK